MQQELPEVMKPEKVKSNPSTEKVKSSGSSDKLKSSSTKRQSSRKVRAVSGSEDGTLPRKHPSVTDDQPPSSSTGLVVPAEINKHQRHYPKNGERGSSKKNLIGLATESGAYQPLSPSQAPIDYPYFNYDSVSEKHLRKEMKRLKHSRGKQRGSKPRGAPRAESALVVRSESRAKGVCSDEVYCLFCSYSSRLFCCIFSSLISWFHAANFIPNM
eukprot:sb/3470084/